MAAAAPLPLETARKLQERTGIRIVQAYGMTESSPITHLSPLDPEVIRLDSPGLPMNNTESLLYQPGGYPVILDVQIIALGKQQNTLCCVGFHFSST